MDGARALAAGLAALALALSPAQVQAEPALEATLIERSDKIIVQLAELQETGALDNAAALRVIQAEMSPLLDFEQLTKQAMGKYWRRTDEGARRQIVAAFRELLEKTYAKVVAQYSGQQVEPLGVKPLPGDKFSVVLKIRGGGKSAEVDYIFSAVDGEYLIGDIKVEGISLVANYRRQFASVIKKEGTDALVGKLQQLAAAKF